MKKVLAIAFLVVVVAITGSLGWLGFSDDGLLWMVKKTNSFIPGSFSAQQTQGRLVGPVILRDVEFKQQGLVIKAKQIKLDWQPLAMLTSNIRISSLDIQKLDIHISEVETEEQMNEPSVPNISIPVKVDLQQLQVDGLRLHRPQQIMEWQQLKLKARSTQKRINIQALQIIANDYRLELNGNVKPEDDLAHQITVDWQTRLPNGLTVNGSGTIEGDIQLTSLQQQINSSAFELKLDTKLNELLQQPSWDSEISVSQFDLRKYDNTLPDIYGSAQLKSSGTIESMSLAGSIQATAAQTGMVHADIKLLKQPDNQIDIQHLELHSPVTDTRVVASGNWLPASDGGVVDLALSWKKLRWPLRGESTFETAQGNGELKGSIEDYQFNITTDRPWQEVPASTWSAQGNGDLQSMMFEKLTIAGLEGRIEGQGKLNWTPHIDWQMDITAHDINPAGQWSEWPGDLNAQASTTGQFKEGQLSVDVDVKQVQGMLRGYPVSLNSKLQWINNGLQVDKLNFTSGQAQVKAGGRIDEKFDLKWNIKANNLDELYPGSLGQLKAQGKLTGELETPLIQASMTGKELAFNNYQVGDLNGDVEMDLFRWQQIKLDINALNLNLQGTAIQSLTVATDAVQLKAKLVSEKVQATILAKGSIVDTGWSGNIQQFDVKSQDFSNWNLTTPAVIKFDTTQLELGMLCWQNSQRADICLSLQQHTSGWRSQLKATQLPLDLLEPWLPADLTISGSLNANANLDLDANNQILGYLNLNLQPGNIKFPLQNEELEEWSFQAGQANFQFKPSGIHNQSKLSMDNGDQFNAVFDLPGAQLLDLEQQQNVIGEAQLTINDLGLVQALIPEVQELKGSIKLKLDTAGTLAQPRLSGKASMTDGSFLVPRLGLNIHQLLINAHSKQLNTLELEVKAQSGEGDLLIKGQTQLNAANGWPTELTITGDNFEVSRIPEAQVLLNPDLNVVLQQRDVQVSGSVHIPYAKLQPKDITTAVRVSEDVVIVGEQAEPQEKWRITTDVNLTLGDRVSFFGFGFEGKLGGQLRLQDVPGQLTTAIGEINIPEGRYRAYGQRLDVEQGRLLFTGGPITNPGLDVSAVRKLSQVTAGIKVRGSLSQPRLELFSIPAMGQTDTLSYLLLGRPIENASDEEGAMMAKAALALGLSGGDSVARALADRFGLDEMRVESSESGDQASLVMGRYLSPQIYISYGVGLIESVNTFAVRYQITDNWQLKAESGAAQGADLLYTIER